MVCCGKKDQVKETAVINEPPAPVDPEHGIYLTFQSGELFIKWANEPPEGETVVAFGWPQSKMAPVYLAKPARLVAVVTNDASFLKGVIEFLKEAGPRLCKITLYNEFDKMSLTPIMLVGHQPGNNIIGDRLSKCLPGAENPLDLDGIDAVAVVKQEATGFDTRTSPLDDFKKYATEANGCVLELDPSGRRPPTLIT